MGVFETEDIPFPTTVIPDPSLPDGIREVEEPGVPGERLVHYEVTYTGDQETSRRVLESTVTREPRDQIVAVGDRSGGSGNDDPDQQQECGLLGSCAQLDGDDLCADDEFDPGQSIDGDLLDPSDLDELELNLPCEDEATSVSSGNHSRCPEEHRTLSRWVRRSRS